jgi:hypothetical protein
VIERSAIAFIEDLKQLPQYVGRNAVEDNLDVIILKAAQFQENVLTLFCGVVSDPELLQAQQDVTCRGLQLPTILKPRRPKEESHTNSTPRWLPRYCCVLRSAGSSKSDLQE